MKRRRSAVSAILFLCVAGVAPAAAEPIALIHGATFATWSVNGHQYAVVPAEFVTWDDASSRVRELLGPGWSLATITSAQEQNFVSSLDLPGVEYLAGWISGAVQGAGRCRLELGDERAVRLYELGSLRTE